VLEAARRELATAGGPLKVDYLALADAGTYAPVRDTDFAGAAVLALAARLGRTRLIDNVIVRFGTETDAADD
jgi:pantoate--beta-alanine ligase